MNKRLLFSWKCARMIKRIENNYFFPPAEGKKRVFSGKDVQRIVHFQTLGILSDCFCTEGNVMVQEQNKCPFSEGYMMLMFPGTAFM